MKKLIWIVFLVLCVPATGYAQLLDEADAVGYAKMKPWKLTNYMKSEFSPHCIHLDENREAAWIVMMCPYFPVTENYDLGRKKPPEKLFVFPPGTPLPQPTAFGFVKLLSEPEVMRKGRIEVEGIEWRTAEYAVPRMPRENVSNPQYDSSKPMLAMVHVRMEQKNGKIFLHVGLANLRDVEVGKALAKGEDVEGPTWMRDTLMVSEFDANRFNKGDWIVMNSPFLQRGLLDGLVVKVGGLSLAGGRTAAEQAELAKSAGLRWWLTIAGIILGWLGCFLLLLEAAKRFRQTRHLSKIWHILAAVVASLLVMIMNLLILNIVAWGLVLFNWGFKEHRSRHPAHL